MPLARFVFQACSFNHSDISPSLESTACERSTSDYRTRRSDSGIVRPSRSCSTISRVRRSIVETNCVTPHNLVRSLTAIVDRSALGGGLCQLLRPVEQHRERLVRHRREGKAEQKAVEDAVDTGSRYRSPVSTDDQTTHHLLPPAAPSASFSMTRSKLKLPAFWLGGNSLKVARNSPTMCCAGTQMKAWSNHQS